MSPSEQLEIPEESRSLHLYLPWPGCQEKREPRACVDALLQIGLFAPHDLGRIVGKKKNLVKTASFEVFPIIFIFTFFFNYFLRNSEQLYFVYFCLFVFCFCQPNWGIIIFLSSPIDANRLENWKINKMENKRRKEL